MYVSSSSHNKTKTKQAAAFLYLSTTSTISAILFALIRVVTFSPCGTEPLLALKCFFFGRLALTCEETCKFVWPPNASLYASSTCRYLRLLATPFDQGLNMTRNHGEMTEWHLTMWDTVNPYTDYWELATFKSVIFTGRLTEALFRLTDALFRLAGVTFRHFTISPFRALTTPQYGGLYFLIICELPVVKLCWSTRQVRFYSPDMLRIMCRDESSELLSDCCKFL